MYSKSVLLHPFVRNSFHSLLKEESLYKEVLKKLSSGKVEIEEDKIKYLKNGLLVVHQMRQGTENEC